MKSVAKGLVAAVVFAVFAGFAWHSLPSPNQARAPVRGSGVVQDVDPQGGMVTIRHGPLPKLNMLAMTMSYAVKDHNQIKALQVDQWVEFEILQNGGEYLITDIK